MGHRHMGHRAVDVLCMVGTRWASPQESRVPVDGQRTQEEGCMKAKGPEKVGERWEHPNTVLEAPESSHA